MSSPAKSPRPLTPKQLRFVEQYLIDLNATQAAIRAGYSPKTARQTAAENLSKPDIAAAIASRSQRVNTSAELKAEDVLRELRRIAFLDPRSVFEWGPSGVTVKSSKDLTPDQAACISEVSETTTAHGGTIRVKLCDKLAALAKLCDHLGLDAPKQIEVKANAKLELIEEIVDGHPPENHPAAPGPV